MITSVHNPKIQVVRRLLTQSKARREQAAFVVEGVRLAEEALQSGWETRLVLFTDQLDQRGKAVVDVFASRSVPIDQVSEAVMNSLSETGTPQGLLAVLAQRKLDIPPDLNFILILDGMRDPGNLGTILRTSAAAGVQAVLLSPGCVDLTAPKVVRAGMGAHFRLPALSLTWPEIINLVKRPGQLLHTYLADSSAGDSYAQADFRSPLAFIVGSEAVGASKEATFLADERVHIPMPGGSESLNAAVAAGILMFEVVRQRTGKKS